MKKSLIILAIASVLGLTACENVSWSQIQSQVFAVVDLETSVTAIVAAVLDEHPDTVSTFKTVKGVIAALAKKDTLTKAEVKPAVELAIKLSGSEYQTELLYAASKIFAKIDDDASIDLAKYREELNQVVSGIEWAIKFHEAKEKRDEVNVVTISK